MAGEAEWVGVMAKGYKKIRGIVTADISVPLFRIAARFCSREDTRIAISGVRVQRHRKRGVILIGTDGHRMIVLHDVHGSCSRPVTLNAKEGMKTAKADDQLRKDTQTRWRVRTGGKIRKGESRIPLVNEPYPDWIMIPEIVRRTRGGSSFMMNPKYLADFMRVAPEIQKDAPHPGIICVPGQTPDAPVLILFPGAPHSLAIVMPLLMLEDTDMPPFMLALLSDPDTQRKRVAERQAKRAAKETARLQQSFAHGKRRSEHAGSSV